jgi:site-specific DNA-cytosine methylase
VAAAAVIRAATLFSGIGAPEAAMPGWHWLWHAEIEPFPAAVLAARHPRSVNLGDVTSHDLAHRALAIGRPDVLVFGSPCLPFSTAGKRLGLDDPRGNLALIALKIIEKVKPHYFVFENVPGLISSAAGEDLRAFLDIVTEIGYYFDVDILDAQHHGLAQRRQRVFVTCENAALGRQKKTGSFGATGLSCLIEMSLGILAAHTGVFATGGIALEPRGPFSADGLLKKTRLFGLPLRTPSADPTCTAAWASWLSDLDATLAKCLPGLGSSAFASGCRSAAWESSADARSSATATASASSSMSPSWSAFLDAVSVVASRFTTSTATREITHREIYTCSLLVLSICERITRSTTLPESFYAAASSSLTALRVFTAYARQTDSDLFGRLLCGDDWMLFIQAAKDAERQLERRLGDWRPAAEVLFEPESLRGHPAPGREAGQRIARPLATCAAGGSGYRNDADTADNLIAWGIGPDAVDRSGEGAAGNAAERSGLNIAEQTQPALRARPNNSVAVVCGGNAAPGDTDGHTMAVQVDTLRQTGYHACHADAQEARSVALMRALRDAVGAETFQEWGLGVLAALWPQEVLRPAVHGFGLRCPPFNQRGLVHLALAFAEGRSCRGVRTLWEAGCERCPPPGWQPSERLAHELGTCLSELPYSPSPPTRFLHCLREACEGAWPLRQALSALEEAWRSACHKDEPAHGTSSIRRLTVEECEALQGFPRRYSAITYRGKEAADGPRYRALGNSMAVPCVKWLLTRIGAHLAATLTEENAA